MYHSIIIQDKNTYTDYKLIPTSRPAVNPPEPKTNYADVNGINGTLDLSTVLIGHMLYNNRSGQWDFIVKKRVLPWQAEYMELLNALHGRYFDRIRLEDDLYYYYKGRLTVKSWKSDKVNTGVSIGYYLEPYKYEDTNSLEDWLWDPFSFETGIIREYKDITVSSSTTLHIPGSSRPYIPTITASTAMTMTYGGQSYNLAAGENVFNDIILASADADLTFSGSGTVSVLYQGAWL